MALIILGKSTCSLCGELLRTGEDLVGLPAWADTAHPLYPYFDGGFHASCFAHWQHQEEALAAVQVDRKRYEASTEYQQLLQQFGKPGEKRPFI